jgi:protein-L-isoaspartate(D-aspartate) O-methyltransferase
MRRIPRHLFVPPDMRSRAYYDGPLPIGLGQTISQPYIVAVMSELLELKGSETVLEIGTGSGYQAAVLGELAAAIHTVERHPELASRAMDGLARLGYNNVTVHTGDGTLGWPPEAPYQAIVVTAAAPRISPAWIEQMDEGAILVVPIGGQGEQFLERWRKQDKEMVCETLFPVAFVPLRGQYGWQEES